LARRGFSRATGGSPERAFATGMRVAEALDTGMVGLNRGVVSDPSAPFGRVRFSPRGREGMLEYTETKWDSVPITANVQAFADVGLGAAAPGCVCVVR
jgi:hypothetical protein